MTTTRKSPDGLRRRGAAFWRKIAASYDLSTAERELLLEAARTIDLVERLEKVIAESPGLTIGLRAHPAVVEIRQQRLALGRLLAQLQIPPEELESPTTVRARRAAEVRWNRKGGTE